MRKKLPVLLIALIILLQAFTPAVFAASKNKVQSQTAYLCPFDPTSEGAGKAVPYTKSTMKLGQEMHKAYKADLADGITKFKEYILPSGKRIDFIDFETKTIHELKPYNPRAMKAGEKQLDQYLQEIQGNVEKFGEGWKVQLDTY
ncbi:hypothetical protein [Desulfosporosinus sp. BICA1-9]|uniref:hypothetical protein n=1 Tax=Desulfosporosinus sp. BICA1-9 TaxID=1531958 RepID=UPI00054AFFFC|nr:hypothetical protein [Desulfosporosinus sp. BICA1-9]KJS89480.1 MAG: hypothetical protein JL57_07095 [Desulfosporosinus sp. BICA1-9]